MSKRLIKVSLLVLAIACGVVSICMLFMSPLQFVFGDDLVFEIPYNLAYFGGVYSIEVDLGFVTSTIDIATFNANVMSIIGYCCVGVGTILTLLMLLKPKKRGLVYTISILLSVALFVAGGVLIYFVKSSFLSANEAENLPQFLVDSLTVTYPVYIAMGFAIASAALNLLGLLVKVKK